MAYEIPLPVVDQPYRVVLHFAETYWSESSRCRGIVGAHQTHFARRAPTALPGQRTFSLYMENQAIVTDFDIVARAGGKAIGENVTVRTREGKAQGTPRSNSS